ncbi:putative DNA polymerase III [Rhodospirillaceae bacterium LM-1]|nr:putative DNA polymerase III [Rhodospirillaceae bacterium LM-1]
MIPPAVTPELLQRIQDIQNAQTTLTTAASAQSRALPLDIFNLSPGASFNASISQIDAKGLLTLSTDTGNFQLRLSVPQSLAVGTQLTLQVNQIGDQSAQFRIMAVDGQPVAQAQATQLPNAVPGMAGGQSNAQVQADAAAMVRTPAAPAMAGIPATVLASSESGQGLQTSLAEPWQPGTQLAVRIMAVTPPAASQALAGAAAAQTNPSLATGAIPAPAVIAQAAATQTAGAVAAPGAGAESQGARDATLQFGMNMQGRQAPPQQAPAAPQAAPSPWMSTSRDNWAPYSPTLFMPPENPNLSQRPAAVPLLLTGTVAPNTSNGQPIVATNAGLLAINTGPMAPGTKLTLEVVGQPIPPQAVKGDAMAQTTPYASSAWPAMEETLDALKFSDPSGAQRLLAALPSLSPRLAANMAAYMGAVRQGDMKSWLGERTIESIERKSGRELVKRLESEFSELAEVSARPRSTSSGNWSSHIIPMMNGQHIEPIQLHVRNTPDEVDDGEGKGGRKGKGGGTRFVVDLDLSKLGPMQIDGLMRGPEKKIDFIIRTPAALPSEMRFGLNRIVENITSASGLQGTVVFQASARFVDTPKLDFPKSKRKPGVEV